MKYWEGKQSEHAKARNQYWKALHWWVPCALALFIGVAVGLLHFAASDDKPAVWAISVVAAFAFVAIWFLRILVRLYISQIHLENDAGERVVIARTYLALLESPNAISEQDRHIVLQQLFRHAATGMVKDDAAPPHPIEMITRQMLDGGHGKSK